MGKGRILRVLEGLVLPQEVTSTLSELLPGYVMERYQQTPDYQQSIIQRIHSLYEAFLFTLDAYPLDPKFTPLSADTLRGYAEECKNECTLRKVSLDDLHKELEKFTAKLVHVLAACWQWPSGEPVKEAIACLNEAECYKLMMNHGRPDIATLVATEIDGTKEYVLQYDEAIPSHYEQLITELKTIKTSNYPKTPSWFRRLPEYQQAYFCNLKLDVFSPKEVAQELNQFILAWGDIKGKSLTLATDLKQIQTDTPPFPNWFNQLSVQLKEMVRVLALKPESIKHNLARFKSMLAESANKNEFKKTLALVPVIPQWYWVLAHRKQCFLGHVLKNSETIEDAVSSLSSRNRDLPAPSNFGAHSLKKISAKGEVVELFGRRFRSSHVATRDGLKFPEAVQQRHCDSNLTKVMEHARPEVPCLMQTLISPIHAVDYVPGIVTNYLPELPPDLELYKLARAAVARRQRVANIWQHNHPFNIAKLYYYTQTTDPESISILTNAQSYVAATPGLKELLDDYKNVLESPMLSATFWDYDGRELYLSSLEQLIILTIGGLSYGSCVSGKDRKAIELLHTDAMILYESRYGNWPKFGDPKDKEERGRFVTTFVDLYISRHQHELAGQNAPGSKGIKTPGMYLPKDIVEEINRRLASERAIEFDDRLATDNEVKYISKDLKRNFLPENELLCTLMAKQLGEPGCTKLYNALGALINETQRFRKPKGSWTSSWYKDAESIPRGIDAIRTVMADEYAGKNNVQRLTRIFCAVLSHPEKDNTSTPATNSVYDNLINIIKPKSGNKLDALADVAVKEWELLFEESKRANLGLVY
ncbi:hypothetical protein TUM19329_02450 [Legionella antarctica]|uniref:Uncharacterized protein n=1 Tax=Legionella antarctica TaxID=2708020 RepID=A0A6F8SZM7_9GAMM|nr:oxidoreductase [Legionella antarctica]BCA93884.1 hypothetical protein TUM19329_02450 [Legionella antarctica]